MGRAERALVSPRSNVHAAAGFDEGFSDTGRCELGLAKVDVLTGPAALDVIQAGDGG